MRVRQTRSVFDQWAADNADVVRFLTAEDFDAENSTFLTQLAALVRARRALTPEQVSAVQRNIARRADRARVITTAATKPGERAPAGRQTVEGTVVQVSIRPGFGRERPDYKMTVDCGYQVWCTVPQALILRPEARDLGLTGARVRFAVTLEPNPTNPAVAIGKSPRQVELISSPTVTPVGCALQPVG